MSIIAIHTGLVESQTATVTEAMGGSGARRLRTGAQQTRGR